MVSAGRCESAVSTARCSSERSRAQKESRRFRRLLKLITGRRQTEWTGATRCPNEDAHSHKRESLIDRKRRVFFRDYLPCRPLAHAVIPAKRRASHWPTLALEEIVGRVLGRTLLGGGLLQARDLAGQKRDAFVQLLDREQRQVLADLVGDLLARPVVVFDWHDVPSRSNLASPWLLQAASV